MFDAAVVIPCLMQLDQIPGTSLARPGDFTLLPTLHPLSSTLYKRLYLGPRLVCYPPTVSIIQALVEQIELPGISYNR